MTSTLSCSQGRAWERDAASIRRESGNRGVPSGVGPVGRVFVMENHDTAYRVWRAQGGKQRILVHVDAHHDMWWIPDATVTIANFICPALKEDILREIFWVVPDATWHSAPGRKAVLHHLRKITRSYPGGHEPIQTDKDRMSTVVLGKPVTVCPLALLPRLDENVLLDIDVDYLVIPVVCYAQIDRQAPLPWCWPEELLARLGDVRADVATIAYSVEGGYTPLKWKYLGDELALRLRQTNREERTVDGMAAMREGALAAHRGDLALAEEKYQAAGSLLPASAAPCFHLAHLNLEMGRVAEGRKLYQKALALDPSYRTAYKCCGFQFHGGGRFREAEREHLRILTLDQQDAYACFGLGKLASHRKRWKDAEVFLRRALALDGNLTDAYRELGKVLVRQGHREEAICAYERSLKLALNGHRPLGAPIATDSDLAVDPGHFRVHARLAHLYASKGATAQAITSYRMSIAGRCDGVMLRTRLAHLYVRQHQWKQAVRELGQAVRRIPFALWEAGRQFIYDLRRM
jgi:tetratricopeptide (TPR) repeat protein